MSERRFTDDEVATIFRLATEVQPNRSAALQHTEGLTLAELQQIGIEVGVSPDLVARAAEVIDRRGTATTRRFLGFPIGVSHTVDLGRALSDAEWNALVVDLRDTFDARGRIGQDGAFRQWTNGNLQALLEPLPAGHRLRLRTINANAQAWLIGGIGMLAVSLATAGAAVVGGLRNANAGSVTLLGLIGVALFAAGATQLPGWARLRRRQMEAIAGRISAKRVG